VNDDFTQAAGADVAIEFNRAPMPFPQMSKRSQHSSCRWSSATTGWLSEMIVRAAIEKHALA